MLQASIRSLLPRLHYFEEGTCVVHHMFGAETTNLVRRAYGDALLTAHFEVPLLPCRPPPSSIDLILFIDLFGRRLLASGCPYLTGPPTVPLFPHFPTCSISLFGLPNAHLNLTSPLLYLTPPLPLLQSLNYQLSFSGLCGWVERDQSSNVKATFAQK